MDKTLDLDELERVAREATQGEWVSFDRDTASNIYSAGNNGSLLAVCHSYTTDVSEKRPNAARRKANATYIATFDPPTILTLIAAARPAVVSDEVVERMCATLDPNFRQTKAGWPEFTDYRASCIAAMRAALALLPGGVPDGYMLVPREPTEAMIRSGQGAADDKYWLWRGLGERPVGSGLDGMALYVDAAYRAMLSASPKGTSVAESAAGDASHLTASETPCKSEWPNPACPCTDPLWCIQRELCKRTTQEPQSPTPCDLEVTDRASQWMLENSEGRWLHNAEDGTFTSDPNLGLKWPNRTAADAFRLGLRGPLWALKLTEHVWIEPEPYDWTDAEDDIADVISDSMDMDWNSRDGARAVVAYLKQIGAKLP